MKILSIFILSFVLVTSLANAQDIDKIKELQKLGFSNEQIVEMINNNQQKTETTNVTEDNTPKISQKLIEKMEKAKSEKKGLVIFFVSKENIDKGPGYLNVSVKKDNKTDQLEPIPILEYSLEGQKDATVTQVTSSSYSNSYTSGNVNAYSNSSTNANANYNAITHANNYNITTGVSYAPDIITSRYIGEYMLDEGTYEMELSRNFIIDYNKFGNEKKIRHKKFHKVEIEAGKATLISYYWTNNAEFGLDKVMSKNHKIVENILANVFGSYLKYVKIQHNK